MESTSVLNLIKEINDTRTQTSASAKDEVRVMRAMLNDPTFKVDVYGRSGVALMMKLALWFLLLLKTRLRSLLRKLLILLPTIRLVNRKPLL